MSETTIKPQAPTGNMAAQFHDDPYAVTTAMVPTPSNGEAVGGKRKPNPEQQQRKRIKTDEPKHPVQHFKELFPKEEIEVSQTGPVHCPAFTAKATVDAIVYEGHGVSKGKAKYALCETVLVALGHTTVETSLQDLMAPQFSAWRTKLVKDFTTDGMPVRDRPLYVPPGYRGPTPNEYPAQGNGNANGHVHMMEPQQVVAKQFSQLFLDRPAIDIEKAKSYPVMVLTELFPDIKVEWVDGIGRGERQFRVESEICGRRFFGEGRSKKTAKLNLAKTVLLCMYDITDFKEQEAEAKVPKAKLEGEVAFEKKFPLTQLRELAGVDLSYDMIESDVKSEVEGEKTYNCTVVVKGVAYEAEGKNKQLAKLRCAKKALEVLKPKKEGSKTMVMKDESGAETTNEVDTSRHPSMVFHELFRDVRVSESENKHTAAGAGVPEYSMEAIIEGKTFAAKANAKKKAKLRLVLTALEDLKGIPKTAWDMIDVDDVYEDKVATNNPATNHPIVLLLKLNPQTKFTVTEDYECDAAEKYKAVALVNEKEFTGSGPNKKAAKTMAARAPLTELYGIDPDTYTEENRTDYFESDEPRNEVSSDICNSVLDAVQNKFTEVFQGETSCKVVAAFVMANFEAGDDAPPQLTVVSIGTGTKCITGDQMDHKGQTLNDCHGEVIACRGFRQFLFNQLMATVQAGSTNAATVFARTKRGGFTLKPHMRVFLYINTAPCGDGRVFTLQTPQQGAKNKTAGLLRTKIENGQGTIPVPENSVQTADGILEGERLRTMSCSDKILKWNAIGVQGALLSYFVDPIYVEGIVVGLHYNYDVLYRALYKRAGKMNEGKEDSKKLFQLRLPKLGTPSKNDNRDTSKATSNSFNWFHNEKTVEAVNSVTGKTVVLSPSRLCKLNFFDKFMTLIKVAQPKKKVTLKHYHEAKQLAKSYQTAKEDFFKALGETDCGKWIGKPYEHDMFGY